MTDQPSPSTSDCQSKRNAGYKEHDLHRRKEVVVLLQNQFSGKVLSGSPTLRVRFAGHCFNSQREWPGFVGPDETRGIDDLTTRLSAWQPVRGCSLWLNCSTNSH